MTVRLHIDRVVVDRSLVGQTDPRDVGPALKSELGRLMKGEFAPSRPSAAGELPNDSLSLSPRGTFEQRLAETLYAGIPALNLHSARTGRS